MSADTANVGGYKYIPVKHAHNPLVKERKEIFQGSSYTMRILLKFLFIPHCTAPSLRISPPLL